MHWKCFVWVYLRSNFETASATFEIKSLEFAKIESFLQNKKAWNLGPKMPYLRIFSQGFSKNYFHTEISTFEFVPT